MVTRRSGPSLRKSVRCFDVFSETEVALSTTEEMKFLLARLFCQGHGSEVQWVLGPNPSLDAGTLPKR